MKQYCILLLAIILAANFDSCKSRDNEFHTQIDNKNISVLLEQYSDSLYSLKLFVDDSLNSTWKLKYPVYRIDFGDVNNDSVPDILVGTIKSTRFDPKIDKRLFIFRITKDYYIRPLWLGSRVAQPLVDFKLKEQNPKSKIRTLEKEQDGTYLVAEYYWRGFGLQFSKYLKRNIPLHEAQIELNKN